MKITVAVSYTHLDVYKRQHYQLPCRDSSGCGYDGGVAAFPETHFWTGRPGGCDGLSGDAVVRLSLIHICLR